MTKSENPHQGISKLMAHLDALEQNAEHTISTHDQDWINLFRNKLENPILISSNEQFKIVENDIMNFKLTPLVKEF